MTLQTYRELGGIVGTLSTSADEAVRRASPDDRRAIRQVLLRLVALGEGRPDTRRRVARSTLDALDLDPAAIDRVLDTFGRLRILTFDREPASREPTVEIAHEALLDAWPRLRGWIDEARDDLRQSASSPARRPNGSRPGRSRASCCEARGWSRRMRGCGRRTSRSDTTCAGTSSRASPSERRSGMSTSGVAFVRPRSSGVLRAGSAGWSPSSPPQHWSPGSLTLVATGQGRRAEREAAVSTAVSWPTHLSRAARTTELAVLLAIEAVERSRATIRCPDRRGRGGLASSVAASRIVATIPGLGGSVATSGDGRMAAVRMVTEGR